MTHEWNVRSLDVTRFAEATGHARLMTPLADLQRVQEACGHGPQVADEPQCEWSIDGQTRGSGSRLQHWMRLQAALTVTQTCQRCLEPMPVHIEVDRWFRFVADEATALAEDDDCEEDLLAVSAEWDTLGLLEDELLLAMPLIVRHADCQAPHSPALNDDLPHAFAALASLNLPKT